MRTFHIQREGSGLQSFMFKKVMCTYQSVGEQAMKYYVGRESG